jgi:DeoR/GlpR family transcriptional regulator of sugar metabolism
MSSKTDERAQEILRLLLSHGKTSIEDLTGIFGTSAASIRRDLVRLEEQGLVHRTHGGAMLAGQAVYEPFLPSVCVKNASLNKNSASPKPRLH